MHGYCLLIYLFTYFHIDTYHVEISIYSGLTFSFSLQHLAIKFY